MNIPASFRRPVAAVVLASTMMAGCVAAGAVIAPQGAYAADLLTATAAVAAPAGLAVTPGNGSLAVKWTASTDATVTGYSIQVSTDPAFADASTSTTLVTGRTVVTKTISGLQAGTAYNVRIASTSAAGVGAYSTAVAASTFSTPGAPVSPKVVSGNKSVTVSWSAPTVTGGSAVTGYQVDYSTDATFASGVTSVNLGKVASTVISGLQDGVTYYARVQAINVVGAGAESGVVSAKTFYLPAVPTSVKATGAKASATVRWVAPADKGGTTLSGFLVEYSKDANFATVAGSVTASATATSAVVSGLDNGTGYYFRVSAKNVVGQGVSSVPVSAVTFNVPGTVSNVTAAGGNASISLKWTAPTVTGGSAITGYRVQYSTVADFSSNVTTVDTLSTSAAYTIKNIPAGQTVYARVAALNTVGAGTYVAAATSATAFTVPGVATSVTATKGAGLVTVKWVAPVNKGGTTLTNYTVQVSTSSSFATITNQVTASSTAVSVNVPGLQPATTYYARVIANNVVGAGQASASASAITAALPGAPTGLTGAAVATDNTAVNLSWKASTALDGATVTGYSIQYSTDSTFATGVSTVRQAGTGLTAKVAGLNTNTVYYFRVATVTGAGTGAYSAGVSARTGAAAPAAPQGVALQALSGGSLKATWSAPSTDGGSAVSSYTLQYSTDSTFATGVTTLPNMVSGSTITGLTPGSTYFVRVAAVNSVGTGAYSAPVSAKVIAAPSAPQAVAVQAASASSMTASWSAPSSDGGSSITSYTLQYSTDSTFATGVSTLNNATSGMSITGLNAGSTYFVRVAAVNAAGSSVYSSSASALVAVAPAAPAAPTVNLSSMTSAVVTWAAPEANGSPISGYTVRYSSDASFASDVHTVNVSGTSAALTDLVSGTNYYYEVLASNAIGSSAYSASTAALVSVSGSAPLAGTPNVSAHYTAWVSGFDAATNQAKISYSMWLSLDSTENLPSGGCSQGVSMNIYDTAASTAPFGSFCTAFNFANTPTAGSIVSFADNATWAGVQAGSTTAPIRMWFRGGSSGMGDADMAATAASTLSLPHN